MYPTKSVSDAGMVTRVTLDLHKCIVICSNFQFEICFRRGRNFCPYHNYPTLTGYHQDYRGWNMSLYIVATPVSYRQLYSKGQGVWLPVFFFFFFFFFSILIFFSAGNQVKWDKQINSSMDKTLLYCGLFHPV